MARRPVASPMTVSSWRVAEGEVHVRVAAARVGERRVGHVTDVHGLVRDRAGVAAGEGLERVEERGEPRHVALELRQDLLVRTVPQRSDVGPDAEVSGVRSSWPASAVNRSVAATDASSRASIALSEWRPRRPRPGPTRRPGRGWW